MVLTASTMFPLGSKAPSFSLPNVSTGQNVSLDQVRKNKGVLVIFMCQHCPFVKHVEDGLVVLGKDYASKEIGIVGVSANDAEKYPDDNPENLKIYAEKKGFPFPLLFDETQEVAKSYAAACTPDFFLFDQDLKLVYRGQMDESRPESGKPVTGQDLRKALDALLSGDAIPAEQKPSMGCNIKWKAGNEPDYFKGKG